MADSLSDRFLSDRRLRRRLAADEAQIAAAPAPASATLYSSWSTQDQSIPTGATVVSFGGIPGEIINQSGFVLKDANPVLGEVGNGVQVPKAGIYRVTYSAVVDPSNAVAAPQFVLLGYVVSKWSGGAGANIQQSQSNVLPPIPGGEDFGPQLEDSFVWPIVAGGGFIIVAFNLAAGAVNLLGGGARFELERLSS